MTPKINPRKILQYIVPPIITVGLCVFLYRDIDWHEVTDGLRATNFLLIGAFLACNLIAMFARALRWRLQLRPLDLNPTLGEMVRSIFGTYAVNLVFPRLGEIWRCSYIARVARGSFSKIFGSMIADRLIDSLCILLITFVTFILAAPAMVRFAAESNLASRIVAIVSSPWMVMAMFLLFIFCVMCVYFPGRFFDSVRRFFANMWHGFASLFAMRRGRTLWIVLTAIIWLGYGLGMLCSLYAFPPTSALLAEHGLLCALVTFVFGSLAMAIPSNGGIGPWQASILLSLCGIYGMERTQALTFATINMAFSTLLTIALGLYTFVAIQLKK